MAERLTMLYPALDVRAAAADLLYAVLDDFSPTAIEERDDVVRAFFATTNARDEAARAIGSRFAVSRVDVSDEDWARRSQANLPPVTVGRITVYPARTFSNPESNPESQIPNHLSIVITPSMGFGTGHHATTRLCLAAMQAFDLDERTVLDVGTGSGVLAIAAARLGASRATGIDVDADAIQSALENLALNPGATGIAFQLADLNTAPLPPSDVVVANLTGAVLIRSAARLLAVAASGGVVIVSGLLAAERDGVARAFEPAPIVWERTEDEWVAFAMKKR